MMTPMIRRTIAAASLVLLTGCASTPAAAPTPVTQTIVTTKSAAQVTAAPVTVTESPAAPVTTTLIKTLRAAAAPAVTVTARVTVVRTVTETAEPPAAAAASSFPDGVYLVGSEIPPGNYKAAGGSGSCVWLTYDSSHTGTDAGFSGLAHIKDTDYSFESSGCGTWNPVN